MLEEDEARDLHCQSQELRSPEPGSLVERTVISTRPEGPPSKLRGSPDARSCIDERRTYLLAEIDKMRTELHDLGAAEQELCDLEQHVQSPSRSSACELSREEPNLSPEGWMNQAELSAEQFKRRILENLAAAQDHFDQEERSHCQSIKLQESPPTKSVNTTAVQEEFLLLQPVTVGSSPFKDESTPSPLHPVYAAGPSAEEVVPLLSLFADQPESTEGSFRLHPQSVEQDRSTQRSPIRARRDRKLSPNKPTGEYFDAVLEENEVNAPAILPSCLRTGEAVAKKERRSRKTRSKSKEGATKKPCLTTAARIDDQPDCNRPLAEMLQEQRAATQQLIAQLAERSAAGPEIQPESSLPTMFD